VTADLTEVLQDVPFVSTCLSGGIGYDDIFSKSVQRNIFSSQENREKWPFHPSSVLFKKFYPGTIHDARGIISCLPWFSAKIPIFHGSQQKAISCELL
jgi:hypothetical protein